MGLFRKKGFVNLGDHCNRNQERLANIKQHMDAFEDAELGSKKQKATINMNSSNSSASAMISSFQENEVAPLPFINPNTLASIRGDSSANSNNYSNSSNSDYYGENDRKKKLANRLIHMTEQIEDLSNQIYHLQQRMEFLEKKLNSRGY